MDHYLYDDMEDCDRDGGRPIIPAYVKRVLALLDGE